jgi:hypothetical protein
LGARGYRIFGDDVHGHDNEYLQDEEKILAGRPDANMPALLIKDRARRLNRGRGNIPPGFSARVDMEGFAQLFLCRRRRPRQAQATPTATPNSST